MLFSKGAIMTVESHTEGEPTRIVVGGVPKLIGNTMAEKKQYLLDKQDWFRKLLMNEPRGHNDMFGAILTEPCNKDADLGVIFTESAGCLNMCGHGTIGAATVAVECGLVEVKEPETTIKFDTPAGLVLAKVFVKDCKAERVQITNVPSFLYKKDVTIKVPDFGDVRIDISFGGSFFVLVKALDLKIALEMKNVDQLVDLGMRIMRAANEQIKVEHPINTFIKTIDLVEIWEAPNKQHPNNYKNCVVFGQAQYDRSPCGTGTSAKLATLYARGELKINQEFVYESILGTKFVGNILKTTKVNDIDAVIPQITGNANITGFANWTVDPSDPFPNGFNPKAER